MSNKTKLLEALNVIDLNEAEIGAINEIAKQDKETIDAVLSIIKKLKERRGGRKVKVTLEEVQHYKKAGKTQEVTARELNVSLSTIRRNW